MTLNTFQQWQVDNGHHVTENIDGDELHAPELCPLCEASPTTDIPCEDLRPGDVYMFLGRPHLITEIEPYEHPTVPGAFGIARAADGWSISLWHGHASTVAAVRA